MLISTERAWVLHKRPSGDTSVHVQFFTREHGIINALYRGGRLPRKQAFTQAFTPLWVSFDTRKDWFYVRRVESVAPMYTFPGKGLLAAWYVNEILCHAVKPADPDDALHTAYEKVLHDLSQSSTPLLIEASLRRFEWTYLTALGLNMSWTHEAKSHQAIQPQHYYGFVLGEGFSRQSEGISGAHLLAMAAGELSDPGVLKSVKWVMRRAIHHALDGKTIQTRALY